MKQSATRFIPEPSCAGYASGPSTVKGLVEAGLGISVVPSLTLFHFQSAVATRPLSLPLLTRSVHLIQRHDASLSVAAQALHDLIVERIGNRMLA